MKIKVIPQPIALGADENYVTDAQLTVIQNTSGVNTGDQSLTPYVPKAGATMTGDLVGHADTDYTTARFRNITLSTDEASGGGNGDIWIKYTA